MNINRNRYAFSLPNELMLRWAQSLQTVSSVYDWHVNRLWHNFHTNVVWSSASSGIVSISFYDSLLLLWTTSFFLFYVMPITQKIQSFVIIMIGFSSWICTFLATHIDWWLNVCQYVVTMYLKLLFFHIKLWVRKDNIEVS